MGCSSCGEKHVFHILCTNDTKLHVRTLHDVEWGSVYVERGCDLAPCGDQVDATSLLIPVLFLTLYFPGYNFHMFGFHVAKHILHGDEWNQSERFPRVTLCDFHIRQNTNVHRYTFQCVLPINLFNEKIFIIVWFWLLFVSLVSSISLIHWLQKSIYWPTQVSFVKRHLRAMDTIQLETILVRKFTENYLRPPRGVWSDV